MIVLDNAGTRALSLINTQNGAQAEVSFSDYTTSTGAYTRGVPTLTTISSGTTTSICATPSSGVIRDIDYVNIYNTYAGSQTFTVQITSGSGGPFILVVATLAQNESLNYTHGSGWCAMDANGNRKESTGTVLASLTVTGNATIGGTLGVTGVATFTAQPIISSLTASRPVFTDASKGLVSNTMTGTGDVVMSTSPTLSTSIVTGASFTFAAAATTLNIGNAGGTNTILGATTFSQALTTAAIAASGTIGSAGGFYSSASNIPGGTTTGFEAGYSSGSSYAFVQGYERNSAAYKELQLDGSEVKINASGVTKVTVASTGIVTMAAYGAGAATFSAAGVISSVSDETWKTKDGIPADPDAMLKKLEPGYWYYNDEKKETFGTDRQLGFYAQNVNAAIGPEAAPEPETIVTKNKDGTETTTTKPWGYYDRSVLAVTVMSLQKALATIDTLTAKVAALEAA